ncbi:MAG: co-chaperone GroES [Myxococcales bacterium FL481]|nr:MAG: co-chaperone GroES [Myxococcales bacterium FL481]
MRRDQHVVVPTERKRRMKVTIDKTTRVRPLRDWVVLDVEQITKTKGGLTLPDGVQTEMQGATVVALGPGNQMQGATTRREFDVKIGDRVLLAPGTPEFVIQAGTRKLWLVDIDYCMAILEPTEMVVYDQPSEVEPAGSGLVGPAPASLLFLNERFLPRPVAVGVVREGHQQ